ncbi:hypothetical protein [Paracraurococcus ruber]|uniref:Uncharacterized protein n=1 Tax=Paracraurococcus ruber TaxID=77675 RepID=A0ABS1CY49_9PROT|nr:hypothetical protein [Paracraurococcus ruber]MBK1659350.1 hypothetical protein [Paracraurococcus ruber]TDG32195.1 hypothetical protein E2C05_08010 [Paracraurococcus ruber]
MPHPWKAQRPGHSLTAAIPPLLVVLLVVLFLHRVIAGLDAGPPPLTAAAAKDPTGAGSGPAQASAGG